MDLLTYMIDKAYDNKVPKADLIRQGLATLKQSIYKNARSFLRFGLKGDARIKYIKKDNGFFFIGEVN